MLGTSDRFFHDKKGKAAEGRAALDSLQALIQPETEAVLLRPIYAAWSQMVREDDLPRLEELVRQGPGLVREYALQTWGRVETRPAKRVEILKLRKKHHPAMKRHTVADVLLFAAFP